MECLRSATSTDRAKGGLMTNSDKLQHYRSTAARTARTGKSRLNSEVWDMKIRICVIVTVIVLTAAGLLAQGDRGIITGTVKDSTGAVVPGVQVTAIHLATNTNYKASTTASGDFTVPALSVGNYQVRVENTGFKTEVVN